MTHHRWLMICAVLLLSALASAMHLHTLNTEQAARIAVLEAAASARAAEDASALVLLPPVDAPVSSPAGWRVRPMGGGESGLHRGTDYSVPVGTPVRASAAGEVVATWPVPGGQVPGRPRGVLYQGWGELGAAVILDHGRGVWTVYGHLSRIDVRRGQRVESRQEIALSGNSGRSTGPHLHWEVVPSPEAALRWRIPQEPQEGDTDE